ncbi:hypothetical protein L1887_56660 [Cichorium endivia]|nr:hypothetical protein L1887_56660 [Cichorium endivia]
MHHRDCWHDRKKEPDLPRREEPELGRSATWRAAALGVANEGMSRLTLAYLSAVVRLDGRVERSVGGTTCRGFAMPWQGLAGNQRGGDRADRVAKTRQNGGSSAM